MAAESNTKIPRPLYAAAAVGDLAYRRLRKLPSTVTELRGRMAGVDLDVDRLRGAAQRVERLRGAAQRNAAALVTNAQAAQERAHTIYTDLVARGEQVVRDRRVVHATVGIVPRPTAEPVAPTSPPAPTSSQAPASPQAPASSQAPTSPPAPTSDGADTPGGTAGPAAKRTRPAAE